MSDRHDHDDDLGPDPTLIMPKVVVPDPAQEAAARKRRMTWVVAAAVAVLVIVAGVGIYLNATAAAAREQAIRETASGYFTALAEADADRAASLLANTPEDRTLLTDEVLQASQAAAPIADVQVTTVAADERNATATVTYSLGERPVTVDLELDGDGRTGWRLVDGLSSLTVTTIEGLTVNGATLDSAANPVFPGTYTAASASPLVALDGTLTATIPAPDSDAATLEVSARLSDEGTARVLEVARASLDQCLASNEMAPPGCPWSLEAGGVTVTEGSIRYRLVNDPWLGFAPGLNAATMRAEGVVRVSVEATANATFQDRTGDVVLPFERDATVTVDLRRDPLTAAWR